MKKIILAAFIIVFGLIGCSVSQPGDSDYYERQPVYRSSPYTYYDPYYNPIYDNRYDSRYYNRRNDYGYNAPVYVVPAYPNRNYRRERGNYQPREQYRQQQPRQYNQSRQYTQPNENNQQAPAERRLPDGTRVSPDGTVTLPNGEVRSRK